MYCVAFLVFRFRAPFRLDEQRVAEIRDASNALIEARDKHARELDTLRESYRVAFKAKEDEEISRLANEKGAAIEEEKARNEAPRYVQRAIGALFAAYRELEIVSNRADDNAWGVFSQRLEEYRAAYALLPLVARRFHERAEPALSRFVRFREFDRLLASMSDARDIMLNGECEMDLTVSPNPVVIISRASRRDRFIIHNMIVGNREDQTVSLFPVWHLYLDPGRIDMTYQADAEPLKDWEEHRLGVPRPANPPLDMPLQLPPKSAATGYWCFFIGDSLENERLLQGGCRHVETVLELHDLASGRRTKSDRFNLELDRMQSLLSPRPLPPGNDDDDS